MLVAYGAMNLPVQHICNTMDLLNEALLIKLEPSEEVLILWAFTVTNRSNFLVLSLLDDAGNPTNYRLAGWQGTEVAHRLQNGTSNKQFWHLTGWEVSAYDGGSGECPKSQDGMRPASDGSGKTEFFSQTPYYDGAGIRPGQTLVTVELR
jgi:hypothetical protein